MFRTGGLIFRKAVVTSTGTVWYMSTCTVQPGSSECGFTGTTIKGFIRYPSLKY